MPRVLRTVIPRIRASLRERGLWRSVGRSFLLPFHLLQEYRSAQARPRRLGPSEFDRTFGVDTDGEFDDQTHLSDLDIPSPNWIHGTDYIPIDPGRLRGMLASLPLRHEDFVFVDFGSGKGRALLIASEFPFRRIVGVEFSPQLHTIAEKNIARYASPTQECRRIQSVCVDFTRFPIPAEPAVFYLFDPCDETLLAQVLKKVENSLLESPREIFIIYAAPRFSRLLDSAGFLRKIGCSEEFQCALYESGNV